jgi:hypothetical protein
MKVTAHSDRHLQLKQSKWLPWYRQIFFWPTVAVLFLVSLGGEEHKLTCRKASNQCQLTGSSLKGQVNRQIPIDSLQKIDLVAVNNDSVKSKAQLVLIDKAGNQTKVGSSDSYETLDDVASRLAWFLESSTAQFIEVSESSVLLTRLLGLGAGTMCFLFLWRGRTRWVMFDRDQQTCDIETQYLWQRQKTSHNLGDVVGSGLWQDAKGLKLALVDRGQNPIFLSDGVAPGSATQQQATVDRLNQFLGFQPLTAPRDEVVDVRDSEEVVGDTSGEAADGSSGGSDT